MSCEDAWAADLFEGEGSIIINVQASGYTSLRLQLAMQDEEPVKRFAALFDRTYNAWRTPAGKVRYTCQISGKRAVGVFERMRPWLSARRIEKYEEAKAQWADQPRRRPRGRYAEFTITPL